MNNTTATWNHLRKLHQEKNLMLERLKAGGEGDDRRWHGWMASLTWWTWVWASSRNWWWTEKTGVSMGLERVGHDWVIELNWTDMKLTQATLTWNICKSGFLLKDCSSWCSNLWLFHREHRNLVGEGTFKQPSGSFIYAFIIPPLHWALYVPGCFISQNKVMDRQQILCLLRNSSVTGRCTKSNT